ncbi:MAG: ATP-binding cassette domain-containing protein [Alphaproteobacteria bacterium]|jgi:cell division transport system ATP-binding protein|nr:ATP-binding cassette domain-containing protein [Alphaproteobacteria bacterium]
MKRPTNDSKTAPALEFNNVRYYYPGGTDVLRNVNFSLPTGSFTYVRGESGAGKSTLLKLAYFGLNPSQGRLFIFGKNVAYCSRPQIVALRRHIGLIFQDFRLLPHLTAEENVALPLIVSGQYNKTTAKRVLELLDWVGLSHRLQANPYTMSGGEQQRLAIARAVICRPRLLIADEPTGNVDDKMATRIMYLFEELSKSGTTILFATHHDTLVKAFPHRQLWLRDGTTHLTDEGAPDDSRSLAAAI